MHTPTQIRPATTLQDERFLLLETLGSGGMAAVYGAYDRAEQRLVALKVARDPERSGPAHPFAAEFDVWSRLCHPNIVRAYELGSAQTGPIAGGRPYLVLEHVRGGPAHRTPKSGPFDATRVEWIAAQILNALAHLHAAGYVHRDLKPDNVLVGGRGRQVKLTDFGLAAPAGVAGEPGVFSGSLPYVSPEGLLGRPLDARSDLYSLGILLYRLAAGEMPAASSGAEDLLRWHLAGPPADLTRVCPRAAPRLARFIERLTARDPAERPASAEHALALLGLPLAAARARPVAQAAGRAEWVRLRLALDAARLGFSRVLRLPGCRAASESLLREASVRAQVQGLGFHRLRRDGVGGKSDLGRLVLRLLAERGNEASDDVRRHGLAHALPLERVGSQLLLGWRERAVRPASPAAALGAARRICDFFLSCAAKRAMVLYVEPEAQAASLTRRVRRILIELVRTRGPRPGEGGLLLLLPAAGRACRPGAEIHPVAGCA